MASITIDAWWEKRGPCVGKCEACLQPIYFTMMMLVIEGVDADIVLCEECYSIYEEDAE